MKNTKKESLPKNIPLRMEDALDGLAVIRKADKQIAEMAKDKRKAELVKEDGFRSFWITLCLIEEFCENCETDEDEVVYTVKMMDGKVVSARESTFEGVQMAVDAFLETKDYSMFAATIYLLKEGGIDEFCEEGIRRMDAGEFN